MGRVLLILSFMSLIILSLGTLIMPNAPAFWLATHTATYLGIRLALAVILLSLILTDPPRNLLLRTVALMLGTAIGGWALMTTYDNHMMFLDSLSLLSAAIAITITALEVTETSTSLSENSPVGDAQIL